MPAQALEERFEALIEPALAGAFARRAGERVAALAALLADGGRGANVERLYTAARLPALQVSPPPLECQPCKFVSMIWGQSGNGL